MLLTVFYGILAPFTLLVLKECTLELNGVVDVISFEQIILDARVDVNIRNVQNTIPLHVALARGSKSCVGMLLSAGANCNMQDDEGNNAFHI
nr:ankyrin repeat-containing protein [Tanacetum cinerariifolium]